MLRIDCWEAEKNLETTPGSDCALNALAVDEPLEYARLYLDGNLQMWVDTEDSLEIGCQDTLPATVFLYHSLFFSDLFNFSRQQKNPRNTRFLGYLTFGHKLSCDNKSIFRLYYSMIVATRPDPTVRPPSRL